MAVPWVKQARSLGITARHSLGLICIPALGRTPSPILGARHQKEIRGINGRVRSAPARPNAGTGVLISRGVLSFHAAAALSMIQIT